MAVKVNKADLSQATHSEAGYIKVDDGHLHVLHAKTDITVAIYTPKSWLFATVED